VLVEDADRGPLWKKAEAAFSLWRDLGFETTLVGLGRTGLRSLRAAKGQAPPLRLARAALSVQQRRALAAAALLVVRDRWPRLEAEAAASAGADAGAPRPVRGPAEAPGPALEPEAGLIADNGSGGFTRDGREYVIRLDLGEGGSPARDSGRS
jgi:hypothetical protein